MKLYTGTSGYSYKEWLGHFYPDKLPAKDMLADYASKLPSVEINNTFYRMPRRSVIDTWAAQVPADFRFAIKASRRITHIRRLNNAADETGFLLDNLAALGERLGVVLFQLPPFQRKDAGRLAAFLKLLPQDTPAAFEFRHASWFDDEIADLLGAHNRALVIADTGAAEPAIRPTADWGYLRLRGENYSDADLVRWRECVDAQAWTHCFVFFKHEDGAIGPRLARQFAALSPGDET